MALITTIIPTFRRPDLLKRAIESALNQTVKESIIYVSDNASGDETQGVVEDYCRKESRVRYFCHATNVGAPQNFAQALERVETPYFSFLQDDDYLLPWFYETALDGFKKHPEAGFSACRTLVVNFHGALIPSQFRLPVLNGYFPVPQSILAMLKTPLAPALWNGVLYKRDILCKVGGLDPSAGTATDFAFAVKCACAFPFVITSKPAAVLFVWPNSMTFSQADSDSEDLDIVFKNVDHYLHTTDQIRSQIVQRLKVLQIEGKKRLWIKLIMAGKIDEARKAKRAFVALGGTCNFVSKALLKLSEKSFLLRKLLKLFLSLRNSAYSLYAWLTACKDKERHLYKNWVNKK